MKAPLFLLALMLGSTLCAKEEEYPKAKVSFDDFKRLTLEVEEQRAKRLINLRTFLEMSKEPGVVILDARSTFRYNRLHLKGAKHLAFTDFTQENLAQVIPSLDTKILIYCNNNFEGNQVDFATKVVRVEQLGTRPTRPALGSSLMMALNVPTYINLYGYGYHNVYELNELVNVNDPRITFEGSTVKP